MAYTPEFRTEAVRLYRLGGRGIKATARQIGVAPGTLRKWVHQVKPARGRLMYRMCVGRVPKRQRLRHSHIQMVERLVDEL